MQNSKLAKSIAQKKNGPEDTDYTFQNIPQSFHSNNLAWGQISQETDWKRNTIAIYWKDYVSDILW